MQVSPVEVAAFGVGQLASCDADASIPASPASCSDGGAVLASCAGGGDVRVGELDEELHARKAANAKARTRRRMTCSCYYGSGSPPNDAPDGEDSGAQLSLRGSRERSAVTMSTVAAG